MPGHYTCSVWMVRANRCFGLLAVALSLVTARVVVGCASTGTHGEGDDGGSSGSSSGGASSSGNGSTSSGGKGSASSGGGSTSGGSSGSGSGSGSGGSSTSSGSSSGAVEGGSSGGGVEAGREGGSVDCSSLPLCDGFENDAPGAAPSASMWTVVMGCNPNMQNAPVDGGLTVGVDNTQAHSGKNSLRVVGGDSCGYYAVNTSAFAKLTGGTLYARFFARFSGAPTQNHNGFLTMASPATGGGSANQLRVGFQDKVIDWNWYGPDTTLPDMDTQGTTLSATTQPNTWQCIEFSVASTTGDIQFWLDGTQVQGLSFTAGQAAVQGVDDQWASSGPKTPITLTSFGLGWLGLNDMYTAWFDDVALSTSRIGCQ